MRYIKDRIDMARKEHEEDFKMVIRAGDIGREIQLSNRIAAICNAMRSLMKELPNSQLVNNSTRDGTNYYIEYAIPASARKYQDVFDNLI